MMNSEQVGRWEIVSMEVWDKDYIDMVETGYVSINQDGAGNFVFGAVQGEIDGAYFRGSARYEFSWSGSDEGDLVTGRGWVQFESDQHASGFIFIHMGEESSLTLRKTI